MENRRGASLKKRPPEDSFVFGLVLSFLFFRRFFRGGRLRRSRRWRRLRRLIVARHPFLKTAHPFAKPAHEFRNFATAEQDQDNDQENQPVDWKFHNASCP